MHLRNYEQPEGRDPGQPEVLVTQHVVAELGMPAVDYDSLHQFFTDDLGIPYDQKTSVRLYGRFENSLLEGFHAPFTRTIHVNPIVAEETYAWTGGTMRVVAHEAQHRSDSTNRKLVTAGDIALRWASYKVGFDVATMIPFLGASGGFTVFGGLYARGIWYKYEPSEKRARAQERTDAVAEHQHDILFPNAKRTEYFRRMHMLSAELLKKLGLEDED